MPIPDETIIYPSLQCSVCKEKVIEANGKVTGITEGAKGHVDYIEIVKDRAVTRAIPIVNVTHPLAKVTHEAAIGSVDKRQMETLMAHGLTS
jgi:Fe-S cluster assembly scaffold protein SufB